LKLADVKGKRPWMDEAEERRNKKLVSALGRLVKARGHEETPLLALRADEIAVCYAYLRRAELQVFTAESEGAALKDLAAGLEMLGKLHERLRKAVKEFDELMPGGAPAEGGLADLLQPVMEEGMKAEEILAALAPRPEAGSVGAPV